MIISKQEFYVKGINYYVRSATHKDAKDLSELRLQKEEFRKVCGF